MSKNAKLGSAENPFQNTFAHCYEWTRIQCGGIDLPMTQDEFSKYISHLLAESGQEGFEDRLITDENTLNGLTWMYTNKFVPAIEAATSKSWDDDLQGEFVEFVNDGGILEVANEEPTKKSPLMGIGTNKTTVKEVKKAIETAQNKERVIYSDEIEEIRPNLLTMVELLGDPKGIFREMQWKEMQSLVGTVKDWNRITAGVCNKNQWKAGVQHLNKIVRGEESLTKLPNNGKKAYKLLCSVLDSDTKKETPQQTAQAQLLAKAAQKVNKEVESEEVKTAVQEYIQNNTKSVGSLKQIFSLFKAVHEGGDKKLIAKIEDILMRANTPRNVFATESDKTFVEALIVGSQIA